ncbi:hypothetical protein [Nostoc sp. MG11]|nr:hypothetical protein [Nostoc sp. MG11]
MSFVKRGFKKCDRTPQLNHYQNPPLPQRDRPYSSESAIVVIRLG